VRIRSSIQSAKTVVVKCVIAFGREPCWRNQTVTATLAQTKNSTAPLPSTRRADFDMGVPFLQYGARQLLLCAMDSSYSMTMMIEWLIDQYDDTTLKDVEDHAVVGQGRRANA
jgi:hypothetical protein